MRASYAVLRGTPGARRSLVVLGAEYLPHNIVIGSVGAYARQSAARERHRCARLCRACGPAFRLRCSGAVEFLVGCSLRACASTQGHTLCAAVLTTQSHQILCGQYPPGHASRPSRPRLSHSAVGKSQARKEAVCRFAGDHDAGGLRRRVESRRTSRVNRTPLAAFNVAGRSPEKTAFRVACLKRRAHQDNPDALVAIGRCGLAL